MSEMNPIITSYCPQGGGATSQTATLNSAVTTATNSIPSLPLITGHDAPMVLNIYPATGMASVAIPAPVVRWCQCGKA
jgi:hypothetical protein